jgi:ribosomal protein S12 methylthiotransferase accessory factor
MAPIVCPNGEHPDIAWWISLDKTQAIWKTIWESVERYHLFNYKKEPLLDLIHPLSYMKGMKIGYFSPSQTFSKNLKKDCKVTMIEWKSLLSQKKIKLPFSLVHCPYKTSEWEDFIGDGTSTGCAAHSNQEYAIINGIEECIERHVNMKIWYNHITPPSIDINTIDDPDSLQIIYLLRKNGVILNILNTTTLNDFWIPSIMIICKNNAGGINTLITSSCKSSIGEALKKALEEAIQWQTRWFLLKKYPNFLPWKNYSNIKYFYQHILFYAQKKNEVYLNFLLHKSKKEKYNNSFVKNDIHYFCSLLRNLNRDCYIFDLFSTHPNFYVYKVFITDTYQLYRDHNQRFLSNIPHNGNRHPHPYW